LPKHDDITNKYLPRWDDTDQNNIQGDMMKAKPHLARTDAAVICAMVGGRLR
jgi:hypothetical protein